MTDIFLQKVDNKLFPADDEAKEVIGAFQSGDYIKAKITRARNYENHKRFFKFLTQTFDMQEHFTEFEAYRKWITMKAGWFVTITAPNGTVMFLPKSIAFDKMEEDEFRKLFSTCIDVFIRDLGKGITEDQLMHVVEYG